MKQLSKRAWIIIAIQTAVILVPVLFAVFAKTEAHEEIVSQTDSVVIMTGEENTLTQAWQAESKSIDGFELHTDMNQSRNLSGSIRLSLKEERESTESLCSAEVGLETAAGDGSYMFELPRTSLELGRRYFFELELTSQPDTELAILSNSNYGGLVMQGEEVRGAVAGSVLYKTPRTAAWLVRICLMFTAISVIVALFYNRRFEEVLGMTFGIVFLYVYIFGCFEQLKFGVQSLFTISMIAAISCPLLIRIKGRKMKDIITPGMIAFWGLFILYFILDRNVVAGKVDDLNHWQLCVRDMWYFDSYAFHPGTTVQFGRYTPGFATIEYLFLYLYGTYREGILMLACHTIGFAMLSILYSGVRWRQCHKVIPLTWLIAALPILIYQSHYGIMYVDAYLGIVGAYLLISYFTEEHSRFNLVRITIGSVFLIMIKEMGLIIAGTVYVIILLDILYHHKKIKLFIKDRYTLKYVISGCISLVSFASWHVYINVVGTKYGLVQNAYALFSFLTGSAKDNIWQNSALVASASNSVAFHASSSTQLAQTEQIVVNATAMETIREMVRWLLREKAFIGGSYAELTLLVILLCAAIGMGGLYQKLRLPMQRIIGYLLIGTAMYTAALVVCYIFLFREASAIPAARRYMGSYLLVFLITVAGTMIVKINMWEESEKPGWKHPLVWIICAFIILNVPGGHEYYSTAENFGDYFTTWQYHQTIGEVFRSFADKDEKVFYVEYSDSNLVPEYNRLTFMNAVVPNRTQSLTAGRKLVVSGEHPFINSVAKYSREEWEKLLREQYSYVYLRTVDDYFVINYGGLFEDCDQIVNGGIYSVDVTGDGGILLRQIAFKDLN